VTFGNEAMTLGQNKTRLTLVQKLVFSYAAMAFFTVGALVYAVMGLNSLHKSAREIADSDLVLIGLTGKMRESIVAQQRYAGKYAILREAEFADLFRRREADFLDLLHRLQEQQPGPDLERLSALYQIYRVAADTLLYDGAGDEETLRSRAQQVLGAIDSVAAGQRYRLDRRLEDADDRERTTVRWALILSVTGFLLAISVAGFFVYTVSRAINKLKQATRRIAEGDFDHDPRIPPGDEIGDLARDFTDMAARLKVLEQLSLDASPLTRLPGNIAIERALARRVKAGGSFAVCYADLDNFKAYNDRYGYIKGNDVIRCTGEIIFDVIKRHGGDDAFVGHVGGDDFVVIVAPDRIPQVCDGIIDGFREMIPTHYTPEDLEKGVTEGIDRYGVQRSFPIMTISIAVLLCQKGEFDSAIEIAKAAAEIKDYVKGSPGSNYLVNRRRTNR
jgi:diguanylate cyclase (GGDEF)-like protein